MESPNIDELVKHLHEDGIKSVLRNLEEKNLIGVERLKVLESVRSSIDATYIVDQTLDRMHEIYDACILEALAIADGDSDTALIEHANILSYNLAANLTDCWDDAVEPRTVEHFQAGIVAANRCLKLREELQKPPAAKAMAYFILGVHEYSLQHYANANEAWTKKLEYELMQYQNASDADSDLNYMLSQALISLARCSMGIDKVDVYENGIQRIEAAMTEDNRPEVDLFVSELVLLRERHGGF